MAEARPSYDPVAVLGVLLIAILLNAYFFGVITQQLYLYWISRFEDPIHGLCCTQFVVVIVQGTMYWQFAWKIYVIDYAHALHQKAGPWQALVGSLCQLVLIIMANTFMASRIYRLTRNRLQSAVALAFSTAAFITGVVTLGATWKADPTITGYTPLQRTAAALWHALQFVAECLIMFFLSRGLLESRSGLRSSDSIVNHLVRNVIQVGLFATIWSLAGLGTYFLLPRSTVYTIFDATSGSIYTHMIYDGLLSRPILRSRMADPSRLEVGLPSQSLSHTSHSISLGGKRPPSATRTHGTVSVMMMTEFNTTQNGEEAFDINKDPHSHVDHHA
ncbi:hypothetical protein BC826DRAFT_989245 [Russula brevipes]|nr:hypothetical protein BC826DRAFT_989245 [Russula brevipes]